MSKNQKSQQLSIGPYGNRVQEEIAQMGQENQNLIKKLTTPGRIPKPVINPQGSTLSLGLRTKWAPGKGPKPIKKPRVK